MSSYGAPPDTAGSRGSIGVIATVRTVEDGSVRLIFDDVSWLSTTGSTCWQTIRLFTFKDFDHDRFVETGLTERELADIGLALVSRLNALACV